MRRSVIGFPLFFVGGWFFNFVVDIQFISGFLSGWLAHSWIGSLL